MGTWIQISYDYSSAVLFQVVPEINKSAIGDSRFIANPNCTTAIAVPS